MRNVLRGPRLTGRQSCRRCCACSSPLQPGNVAVTVLDGQRWGVKHRDRATGSYHSDPSFVLVASPLPGDAGRGPGLGHFSGPSLTQEWKEREGFTLGKSEGF